MLAETLVGVSALVFLGGGAGDRDLTGAVFDYLAAEMAEATPLEKRAWCAACRRRARRASGHALPAEREFYRRLPAVMGLHSRRSPTATRRPRRRSAAKISL